MRSAWFIKGISKSVVANTSASKIFKSTPLRQLRSRGMWRTSSLVRRSVVLIFVLSGCTKKSHHEHAPQQIIERNSGAMSVRPSTSNSTISRDLPVYADWFDQSNTMIEHSKEFVPFHPIRLAMSADGAILSVLFRNSASVWRLDVSPPMELPIEGGLPMSALATAVSDDGSRFAIAHATFLAVHELPSGRLIISLPLFGAGADGIVSRIEEWAPSDLVFSLGGSQIAVVGEAKGHPACCWIWDLEKPNQPALAFVSQHLQPYSRVVFDSGGDYLACATDESIEVLDIEAASVHRTLDKLGQVLDVQPSCADRQAFAVLLESDGVVQVRCIAVDVTTMRTVSLFHYSDGIEPHFIGCVDSQIGTGYLDWPGRRIHRASQTNCGILLPSIVADTVHPEMLPPWVIGSGGNGRIVTMGERGGTLEVWVWAEAGLKTGATATRQAVLLQRIPLPGQL